MSVADSYSRGSGTLVQFVKDRQASYDRSLFTLVIFWAHEYESYDRVPSFGSLDSTSAIVVRIDSVNGFVQRSGTNIGDLIGKIYDAVGGNSFVIVDVAYSIVGESGPWYNMEIKTTDPQYNWPGTGSPTGDAFKIPVEVLQGVNNNIWIRLRVSY